MCERGSSSLAAGELVEVGVVVVVEVVSRNNQEAVIFIINALLRYAVVLSWTLRPG